MPERKNSEKRIASNNKWTNAHYDRVNLALPKGQKDRIQVYAAALGESVNGFVSRVIMEAMELDGGGTASEITGERPESTAEAGVGLPSETLEVAQRAAEATGEGLSQFVARAVETQAQRDRSSLRMGLNPVTGDKLEKEA